MSNSVDIMINGRQTVTPAVNSTVAGLGTLNSALHSTQDQLRSMNSLMELAFGVHIGRFFFEKVHDFIGNLDKGVEAAFGLKTQTQLIAEMTGKMAENAKQYAEHLGQAEKILAGRSANELQYSRLPGADQVLKGLYEDAMRARAAAAPAQAELDKIQRVRAAAQSGTGVGLLESMRTYGVTGTIGGVLGGFDTLPKPQQIEQYKRLVDEAKSRFAAYIEYGGKFQGRNATLESVGDFLGNRWAALRSRVVQGIVDVDNAPGNALWRAIAPVLGMVASGANRQSVEEQLRIERMRLKEGQTALDKKTEAVQRVGAVNERFLTQGSGNPMLSEAVKTNANLEAIKDKIKDLEKKLNDFNAVGVAAKL